MDQRKKRQIIKQIDERIRHFFKDTRRQETYIKQKDRIIMMEAKLRRAYNKANKQVEYIYDHTNGTLELFITKNPFLRSFNISLDNINENKHGILTQQVINLDYDHYSFEEFIEIVAAIADEWKFVVLMHDFNKKEMKYIRDHIKGTAREDIVVW